jgi:hypothetical protein
MEVDRIFNSVEVTKSLCIPTTAEINPSGKISEIKYNTKTKTLMLKTPNGWKHFGKITKKTTPKPIDIMSTKVVYATAPPLYENKIEISQDNKIIDVDYVQSGLYNEIISNPNAHLKFNKDDLHTLLNFLDLLKITYLIKDDYASYGYLQIIGVN